MKMRVNLQILGTIDVEEPPAAFQKGFKFTKEEPVDNQLSKSDTVSKPGGEPSESQMFYLENHGLYVPNMTAQEAWKIIRDHKAANEKPALPAKKRRGRPKNKFPWDTE